MQLTALLDAVGAHPGFDALPNLSPDVRVVSAAHPWLVAAAATTVGHADAARTLAGSARRARTRSSDGCARTGRARG